MQGLSEGTGSPKAYLVPFTSQSGLGTQVVFGQHSPGIFSSVFMKPGAHAIKGQRVIAGCTGRSDDQHAASYLHITTCMYVLEKATAQSMQLTAHAVLPSLSQILQNPKKMKNI